MAAGPQASFIARVASCVGLMAAALLWPAPSSAVDPALEQIQLLNKGAQATEDGQPEVAQAHYRKALELGSLNVAHLGLGRALQMGGGCRDALAEYTRARAAPAVDVPPPEQVEALIDRFTEELRQSCPGTLVVSCSPPEIKLTLEGKPIACGEVVARPPGRYTLSGTLQGDSAQQVVTVVAFEDTAVTLDIVTRPSEDIVAAASLAGFQLGRGLSQRMEGLAEALGAPEPTEAVWGWGLVGAGAASLAVGGIFTALVLQNTSEADALSRRDSIDPDEAQGVQDEGTLLATFQFVGYGLGLALAITGVVILTSDDTTEGSVLWGPMLGADRWGIALEMPF